MKTFTLKIDDKGHATEFANKFEGWLNAKGGKVKAIERKDGQVVIAGEFDGELDKIYKPLEKAFKLEVRSCEDKQPTPNPSEEGNLEGTEVTEGTKGTKKTKKQKAEV